MQKGADPLDAARARLEREYLSALESSLSDQRAERVIFDALTCSISLLEQAQVGQGHAFSRCKVKAPS